MNYTSWDLFLVPLGTGLRRSYDISRWGVLPHMEHAAQHIGHIHMALKTHTVVAFPYLSLLPFLRSLFDLVLLCRIVSSSTSLPDSLAPLARSSLCSDMVSWSKSSWTLSFAASYRHGSFPHPLSSSGSNQVTITAHTSKQYSNPYTPRFSPATHRPDFELTKCVPTSECGGGSAEGTCTI